MDFASTLTLVQATANTFIEMNRRMANKKTISICAQTHQTFLVQLSVKSFTEKVFAAEFYNTWNAIAWLAFVFGCVCPCYSYCLLQLAPILLQLATCKCIEQHTSGTYMYAVRRTRTTFYVAVGSFWSTCYCFSAEENTWNSTLCCAPMYMRQSHTSVFIFKTVNKQLRLQLQNLLIPARMGSKAIILKFMCAIVGTAEVAHVCELYGLSRSA